MRRLPGQQVWSGRSHGSIGGPKHQPQESGKPLPPGVELTPGMNETAGKVESSRQGSQVLQAESTSSIHPFCVYEANSMGFRASAKTLCRLNLVRREHCCLNLFPELPYSIALQVAPALFPLPYVLRPKQPLAICHEPANIGTTRKRGGVTPASVPPSIGAAANTAPCTATRRDSADRRVHEAGLLWRLRLPLIPASADNQQDRFQIDFSCAPDCVDPKLMQQEIEGKGEELHLLLQVMLVHVDVGEYQSRMSFHCFPHPC